METFRLWLEPDKDMPQFQRLRFEKVTVPLADVLLRGIHPWQGRDTNLSLKEKLVEVLNSAEMKLAELVQFGYCGDVSCVTTSYYYQQNTPFEETLKRIGENIYFVDSLSYVELLKIARERLRLNWSHRTAYALLSHIHTSFDAMRSFLKTKDKNIKLSGYADLDNYDLGQVLSLDDFEGEDSALMGQAIPTTNFRFARFLDRAADERGLLRLTDGISHFQITLNSNAAPTCATLLYNCRRNGTSLRFVPMVPVLTRNERARFLAKQVAAQWRTDNGIFCFTTDIPQLTAMVEQHGYKIRFPSLNYTNPQDGPTSDAKVAESELPRYSVAGYLTTRNTGDSIKAALREHSVSMTGRKELLVEKLADLSAEVYEEHESEMDRYFSTHRFIRVTRSKKGPGRPFPVLENLDLRNMVLTMYITKHLRGNTILEATHNNDTFDLLSLARSLIKGEVSLVGTFLRVQ